MKVLASCLILALLVIPTGMKANDELTETFCMSMPQILKQWKVSYQKESLNASTTRFILANETASNWSELVNIQFKERKLVKCSDAVAAMKKESAANKGVTIKTHSSTPNDLIFEKVFPTGIHEIVRMIMTEKGLHRIAYVKRVAPFTEIDRSQWLERISQGALQIE